MGSPPKPWEVNPQGTPTPGATGSSSTTTATAGATTTTPATTASTTTANTTTGLGLGSSMYGRSGYGMGSSLYGGSYSGMYGGYGGYGGGYGGYGMGMGMGGMPMSAAEQKSQMLIMMTSRMVEMVGGLMQISQVALNGIMQSASNITGLYTQFESLEAAPPSPSSPGTATRRGVPPPPPTGPTVSDHIRNAVVWLVKRILIVLLLWKIGKQAVKHVDARFLRPSSTKALPVLGGEGAVGW